MKYQGIPNKKSLASARDSSGYFHKLSYAQKNSLSGQNFFLNKNFKIRWNLLMSKSDNDKLDAIANAEYR